MIPNFLLYPFRVLFSGYFNDDQIASFLTGAFTVGLVWLSKILQECIPEKFTREWAFPVSFDLDEDDEDEFSVADPWNAPLTYVSTQQRRMVRSSISTMKNIGELPQRFKRKHWPWETIRRKVLGEESDNEEEKDGGSTTSNTNDSMASSVVAEEKKDDEDYSAHLRGGSPSSVAQDDDKKETKTSEIVDDQEGCAKKDEKQLCIGSIFGLDVGGTLAKLVYFEKKAQNHDPLQTRSLREKQYLQAVSAQTVLMARIQPEDGAPAHGRCSEKRSTSMSPMRAFPSSVISERNRVRSSTADELEFLENHNESAVVRNKILPIHRVSGRMPRRRTADKNNIHPISIQNTSNGSTVSEIPLLEGEEKNLATLPQHESRKEKSSEDLKNLYAMRQESLPDDIRQFQDSSGFLNIPPGIEEVHERSKKDIPNIIDDDDKNDSSSNPPESSLPSSTTTSQPSLFRTKHSVSMLDLSAQHDRQKAEALNRFYDFARRLDTNEDSISDIQLSFNCRELGGEFHFISFETRKMKNAMDLIRFNNLHMNIQNMGWVSV